MILAIRVFLNLVRPWRIWWKTIVVSCGCRWCKHMWLCSVCHHWTHKVPSSRVLIFFCYDKSLMSSLSRGWGADRTCVDLLLSWEDLSHCRLEMIIGCSLKIPSIVPRELIIIIVIIGVIHYLVITRLHWSSWATMIFLLVQICRFFKIILHCLSVACRCVLVIMIVLTIAWFQRRVIIIHSHESPKSHSLLSH